MIRVPAVLGLCLLLGLVSTPVRLAAQEERTWTQEEWGLGFTLRTANIPFASDDHTVATLIPLIMFENRWIFLYETEGGLKLVDDERWRLSVMGRAHFFDIPQNLQNEIQGDRADWGIQLRRKLNSGLWLDAEVLSDGDGHSSVRSRITHRWAENGFRLDTSLDASYRTQRYNTFFWGLQETEVQGGVDVTAGFNAHAKVFNGVFFHGAFTATYLSAAVRDAPRVDGDVHWQAFLGLGLTNDDAPGRVLSTTPYLRIAHHWATPSTLAQIFMLQAEPDPFESTMTSVFYGHPLTDRVFSLPLPIYLHAGAGIHWPSTYQKTAMEFIISIKGTYTLPLPVRIRIGLAEGVSVVSTVPIREAHNIEGKGYRTSEYMNYMDPSVDVNLGDIIPGDAFDGVWLGYVIHHRSSIYERAQQFGRLKGGSNYQGIYLQFDR